MAWASELRGTACALGVLACVLGAARAASAQGAAGLTLAVEEDAEACVTQPGLRARVDRFLRVRRPIDVEIVVRPGAKPPLFELRRDGAFVAERRFDVLPEGCAARLDAIGLAIAVAVEQAVGPEQAQVDAEAVAAAQSAEEAEADEQPAETTAPREAQPSKPAAEAKKAEEEPRDEADDDSDEDDEDTAADEAPSAPLVLRAAVLAGVDVLFQALPGTALAAHAGAELRLGPTFAVTLAALLAPSLDVDVGPGRASTTLLGLRALGCAGTEPRGLRLEGCAGAAGGVVRAHGEALPGAREARVGWLAPTLRAALVYPAERPFGARLALDGFGNVVSPGVSVGSREDGDYDKTVSDIFGGAASIEVWLALP